MIRVIIVLHTSRNVWALLDIENIKESFTIEFAKQARLFLTGNTGLQTDVFVAWNKKPEYLNNRIQIDLSFHIQAGAPVDMTVIDRFTNMFAPAQVEAFMRLHQTDNPSVKAKLQGPYLSFG